jgi:hypothetical protein
MTDREYTQIGAPTMQKTSRRNNKPNMRRKEDFRLGCDSTSTLPGTALEKLIQSRRKAWEAHKNSFENNEDKFVLYIRALSYMLLIYY